MCDKEQRAATRAFELRIDPLGTPPRMPEPPEARPEDLQRYLPPEWSARGPN
jgi:hypothetical protein